MGLSYTDDKTLATTNEEPTWINVPNTVNADTVGLSKAKALKHVPGSRTTDPMDTVLMLGYNNLQTGHQMPGFGNKWTFTSRNNMLVGPYGHGIGVDVKAHYDSEGYGNLGIAPGSTPQSTEA